MSKLAQKRLKELLHYNPETGIFTWKVSNSKRVKIGDVSGYTDKSTGYIRIAVDGKDYHAHRLAFLYVNGEMPNEIDHINHARDNNRWKNLRVTTRTENQRNRTINKNNTSGFTGVNFCRTDKKWRAVIKLNGKKMHLGYFIDKRDAITARVKANKKYGFHENHGAKSS